jgi:hypothetical protein
MAAAPLRILIVRHPDDTDTQPLEEAIVRAFQGGKDARGYLATGEDLGIQLEVFPDRPPSSAAEMLDSFCHTLTLVLVDRALMTAGSEPLWDWLADCWTHTTRSDGRHRMIAVPMDERLQRQFGEKRPNLGALQTRPVQALGERDIRATTLALSILHECRVLLARALPSAAGHGHPPGHLRLFISHAKIDGLPLAQALKYHIQSLGLESYYDAEDLRAGDNWQVELERGVESSLIVMLRTNVYDSRYWCQQEVRWSDEYATPAVLVDARTGLDYPAGVLPFDRVPTVRVPDGNLVRVLFLALREGLRFLHFRRRVEEMRRAGQLPPGIELRVFSFPPSMPALLRACRSLSAMKPPPARSLILYPDPPFRTGQYEAATALVAAYAPETRLVTPDTLAAAGGTIP